MTLLAGVVLMGLSIAAFMYSLPRGGRTAPFVGTEWEGYAVTTIIGTLAIGAILSIVGVIALAE